MNATAPALRQAALFRELIASSERQATARAHRIGPIEAEICQCCRPAWYIVRTEPNRENTAAAHLVARRFGIYIPELTVRIDVNGRAVTRSERMFPGYILLFAWDIESHRRRIEACPGAVGILRHASGKAVQLADEDVNHIQHQEAFSALSGHEKRQTRRRRAEIFNQEIPDLAIRVSCKSYWADMRAIDSSGRIAIFRRALGLI